MGFLINSLSAVAFADFFKHFACRLQSAALCRSSEVMFNRICARLRQDHRKQMFSRFSRQVLLISSAAVISAGTIGNVATFSHCEEAIQNRIQPVNEEVMILKQIRPACDKYERLDELHLSKKENQDWLKDHVIHGNLNKETGIEVYEIYKMSNEDELVCIIKFGSALNGYPGVVHGGITALMFDNSFGWLLLSSKNAQAAVTANLNVNYR